ncbi:MAG: hypothetical protein KA099_12130 [Alphaproteobacteria bacterium]|nr:hypothetical protein [Alphaproteobacteria bacterium]MBP7759379.1 hypothetical protein [Alphaproteobacteria bacterium]MBP7762656.1 hypothetical protein [Alphaproteobacteria bacterium]MBP7906060.1 hypothetical protein [Alphaproteobacteria bacterium]
MNHIASGVLVDAGRAVGDFCSINKTRISGALSAISSVALGYEGVRSQNPVLITSALAALSADAILIRYGDPIRDADDHNPQDKKFEWKDSVNFKDYPHETSTIGYTAQSAVMAAADIGSGNLNTSMGYLVAGATDLMGSAITFFVREKENPTEKFKNAVLNLPGIKQIANLAETRTNLAAGLISITGLGYLTVTDLAKNNWSVETSAPILTFSIATLGSEVFYWFAEKRGHVREELEEKGIINNDIDIEQPGMARDI